MHVYLCNKLVTELGGAGRGSRRGSTFGSCSAAEATVIIKLKRDLLVLEGNRVKARL